MTQEKPDALPSAGRLGMLDQALGLPELAPIRLFWQNLNELRPWWPILLPLLAWVGLRAYRREHAALQHGRANLGATLSS